ncbi:MAG: alpha/beta hydrolase [Terrisporobacter sp.]|uniref:alpha/beta hydrolase n=1 Tax=Terrisporobacter sp. TaxID=1965305 RepID=UPI002FC6FCE7
MKKRKAKSTSEDQYDTFSITMELEKPLLYNEGDNLDKKKQIKKEADSKKLKKGIMTLLVVIVLFVAGFFIWLSNGYKLESNSLSYLESDSDVKVTIKDKNIYFTPNSINAVKGFIFYPGERVDVSSYAKLGKKIASYGYEVVLVDMPFDYSSFGKDKATEIIKNNDNIENWVIGGDSLGGSVACKYALNNKNVDGVILISSYPTDNISDLGIEVLSISGSKDDVIDYNKLINSKDKLPTDTNYVEIEGANHSQFGSYGLYSGDGEALISEDEQIDMSAKKIVNFLYNIQ